MVEDEWVQAAITDDNLVVEFLLRLKAAPSVPKSALPALKWGIRQWRSRPVLFRCDSKRDGDFNVSARGSPTTPLCWSGGSSDASPSAAADGFEETSAHVLRSPPRSKGSSSSETNRTSTKRLRRKKTFAELKEEENFLLKERVHLKKEIASTRATCNEHRATNDNLKRIKIDLNLVGTAMSSSLICNEPGLVPCPRAQSSSDSTLVDDREKSIFVLPDLNMMPAEDDFGPGTLYGTS
ncbi:hypothetical protein like AT4G32030 [Hibiscus trionum]|uniref:BZIP domain-containing protein n=1 Tax=Hibiscus trionum TaxID=183268 RepID=A0A9W7II04_HIBTR|nr:hypothetical protein like AT4G32030 [Hibiscus trionum]